MSDFPNSIFTPRETENLAGVVFDPLDKKNLFSEDYQNLGGEINAIENALGLHFSSKQQASGGGLVRPVYLRGVAQNLAIGNNDIYTVPTGKKALIFGLPYAYNTGGVTATVALKLKIGTIYNPISQILSIPSSNQAQFTDFALVLLNAGEKFSAVVTGTAGVNLAYGVVEFDDTVPLVRASTTFPATGALAVYTVPVGKTSVPFCPYAYSSPNVGVSLYNFTGSIRSYNMYLALPSASASSSNRIANNASVAVNGFARFPVTFTLASQNILYLSSNLNSIRQFAWVVLLEI